MGRIFPFLSQSKPNCTLKDRFSLIMAVVLLQSWNLLSRQPDRLGTSRLFHGVVVTVFSLPNCSQGHFIDKYLADDSPYWLNQIAEYMDAAGLKQPVRPGHGLERVGAV